MALSQFGRAILFELPMQLTLVVFRLANTMFGGALEMGYGPGLSDSSARAAHRIAKWHNPARQ